MSELEQQTQIVEPARPWYNILLWRGRAARTEFVLLFVIPPLVVFLLNLVVLAFLDAPKPLLAVVGILWLLAWWLVLMAMIRRLHDMDKSVWWLLTLFAPFIGWWWLPLICLTRPGTEGANRYGAPTVDW